MPLNQSPITSTVDDVSVRIYYDDSAPMDGPQPLVNGPRGWCLDLTNASGVVVRVDVGLPTNETVRVQVGRGDPVSTGPASGRSRTAAQLAALGFQTRADVASLSLG